MGSLYTFWMGQSQPNQGAQQEDELTLEDVRKLRAQLQQEGKRCRPIVCEWRHAYAPARATISRCRAPPPRRSRQCAARRAPASPRSSRCSSRSLGRTWSSASATRRASRARASRTGCGRCGGRSDARLTASAGARAARLPLRRRGEHAQGDREGPVHRARQSARQLLRHLAPGGGQRGQGVQDLPAGHRHPGARRRWRARSSALSLAPARRRAGPCAHGPRRRPSPHRRACKA